jgi:hypothetical protein
MTIEYAAKTELKDLNQVLGADEKGFERYMQAKEAFLAKREEACVKQISEASCWQMARVA